VIRSWRAAGRGQKSGDGSRAAKLNLGQVQCDDMTLPRSQQVRISSRQYRYKYQQFSTMI